jgi:hypothetical protein
MSDALFAGIPQLGAGAQASNTDVVSQLMRLSKTVPPLQEVPEVQPSVQLGSNKTAVAKLPFMAGQFWEYEGRRLRKNISTIKIIFIYK